jgi:hypothetical protein
MMGYGNPMFIGGRAIIDTPTQTQQASLYQPVRFAVQRTPVAQVEYFGDPNLSTYRLQQKPVGTDYMNRAVYGRPVSPWEEDLPYGNPVMDFMGSRKVKALAFTALLVFLYFRVLTPGGRTRVRHYGSRAARATGRGAKKYGKRAGRAAGRGLQRAGEYAERKLAEDEG